jgi:hypothetical protein
MLDFDDSVDHAAQVSAWLVWHTRYVRCKAAPTALSNATPLLTVASSLKTKDFPPMGV